MRRPIHMQDYTIFLLSQKSPVYFLAAANFLPKGIVAIFVALTPTQLYYFVGRGCVGQFICKIGFRNSYHYSVIDYFNCKYLLFLLFLPSDQNKNVKWLKKKKK